MSTDRTRPAGRRDQRGPRSVPPQRSRQPLPHRPQRPHQWFAERLLAVLAPSTPLGATRGSRPVLRHCRGAQPVTGVVEAFASIVAGDRVRAMAFRLEQGSDQRWRCAAVELGGERLTAAAPGRR
ncbi:Rv3235 family protein [Streptomyces californicus]|uniref:Rv3235 family protein n=1 Tax=Streptomyces californicus TaxID=67351 RepID=UPI0004C22DDE|nr:Rv3235 family protein [Streptomyces californicus]